MTIRPLPKELQKKAEEELNEVPSRIEEDLKHLREWLNKQPHLTVRKDDQWLLGFLRGCKSSLEQTKEKIDYFHTMRNLVPEFYANRDPLAPEIQKVLKANVIMVLPKTVNPSGPRIMLGRMGACSNEDISYQTLMKVFLMTFDILMKEDDNSIVAGILAISDLKSFSKSYALQFTPSLVHKTVLSLQDTYPIRFKGFRILNAPSLFDTIFNMAKPFMKEKLKNRIILYREDNIENLYNEVPQSMLPTEFGGDAGSMKELSAAWKDKVESYREWFLEDCQYCSNESLRPGKPKTSADIFGVEGSFRKLTID